MKVKFFKIYKIFNHSKVDVETVKKLCNFRRNFLKNFISKSKNFNSHKLHKSNTFPTKSDIL